MSDQNRCFRNLEGIEGRFVAAMGSIYGHADFVHALDNFDSEITDPFVVTLGAAITNQIPGIVSQERDSLAKLVKTIDILNGSKMFGILQADNNPDFPGFLRSIDPGSIVNAHEFVGVMRNKAVPMADKRGHFFVGVWASGADRNIHRVDA